MIFFLFALLFQLMKRLCKTFSAVMRTGDCADVLLWLAPAVGSELAGAEDCCTQTDAVTMLGGVSTSLCIFKEDDDDALSCAGVGSDDERDVVEDIVPEMKPPTLISTFLSAQSFGVVPVSRMSDFDL